MGVLSGNSVTVKSQRRMKPGTRTDLQLIEQLRTLSGEVDRCRVIALEPLWYEAIFVFHQDIKMSPSSSINPSVTGEGARGFTLIELLVVVAIVGVIAAIAVPSLVRARMSGNEAAAIGSLRAINSSQQAYSSSCANGFYAPSLVALGTAPTGGAAFISPDLGASTAPTKSGYIIGMTGIPSATPAATVACNAIAAAALSGSYWSSASPTSPGSTGTRYFWTNALGTIYTRTTAPITDAVGDMPPAAGPTPLQ